LPAQAANPHRPLLMPVNSVASTPHQVACASRLLAF